MKKKMIQRDLLNDPCLEAFWGQSQQKILEKLQVDQNLGLTEKEASSRLRTFGDNTIKAKKNFSTLKLLFDQFNSPLIYMLIFAATLSLLLYDHIDAIIIFVIIIISTLLSFYQEKSSVKAIEELLKIVQIKANVIRDNIEKKIAIEKVVPGDIVIFHAGDIIPGDCYLLESKDLFVDEASLTGESFYTEKFPGVVENNAPIGKRTNVLFMGTHIVSGTAKALVVLTGKNSEFGKISSHLSFATPETEFEHGIRHFSYFLIEVTFFLLIVIFAFNVYLSRPVVESLLFALSLSVGLTPQLLPAIITITLSRGAKKMAKQHVIVKKLASIENFGSMNVLCSDKTGTLTTGEIKLEKACNFLGKPADKVLLYAYLNSSFQKGYVNPIDNAILKTAQLNIDDWRKCDELPYDFIRKRLSILVQKNNEDTQYIITKGAFHNIVSVCSHIETVPGSIIEIAEMKKDIDKQFVELSHLGYRVLGISYRQIDQKISLNPSHEQQMVFLGFLVFLDPIKDDAKKAIDDLKNLGVDLKIITGDNKLIALHVAQSFGINESHIITGEQLLYMHDNALMHQVNKKSIFAEIEPNQKERIILALRKTGNVVGFLGDGINDVTALHAADVSITVDSGADVAKEVANIVLMKKDLSVLKEGVKAGRKTFANTLKYIFMASSANFGNMFSMAGASLFLSFLPLLPKQVLLTNLLTDFPEMAISTDHVDNEVLQKPVRWNIAFIRKFMWTFGLISSCFDYVTFGILLFLHASVEEFRTTWFIESVVSATLIVLIIRTFRPFFTSWPSPYLSIAVAAVVVFTLLIPFMPFASYLGFVVISYKLYLCIAAIVLCYILAVEAAKVIFLKKLNNSI